ncbi:BTAD domain-containing putative transcriptional regulator [Actinopolymorpha pittospori]|uniref:ATPase/DNA-binding SARP family transcriptional activator/putative nucleic acid-binding protein n=1 Tax=Actinopolymorpha pittospori TaxID=648752 RepID=A0A927MT24_9ACTN|nr:putative ATPase/DNA-binding SARP family transcriptional activator/putative nucleic acid-binding protein [Actinopolymorpha pittospori]
MQIAVLGPLEVRDDHGRPVEVNGARLRALVVRLAIEPGRLVSAEALIDALWGATPPSGALNALQSLVSRLRRILPPESPGAAVVESRVGGYRLAVASEQVDAHRFERLATQGHQALEAGDHARATAVLHDAERLWRGPVLADALDAPYAEATAARLTGLRCAASEDRIDAELALGRHGAVLPELERIAAEHPLRERLQGQLMRALYAGGRQADALAVYERVRHALAEDLGVDPSTELADLHLALLRQDPSLTPPAPPVGPEPGTGGAAPAPKPGTRGTVRAQFTSFVGREMELDRVAKLLDESRLVMVVGPGGAGKTRLATELVSRHYAVPDAALAKPDGALDGLWFAELAPVTDSGDVAQAVLSAAGVRETALLERTPISAQAAGRDAVTLLVDALAHRRALLVLDNCEHVVAAAARLADSLLAACPGLRILGTSREPLSLPGEVIYTIPPLRWPDDPSDQTAASATTSATTSMTAPATTSVATPMPSEAEALDYPAVRLFVDRAAAALPDFALTSDNVDFVVEICRRLDGMPLAIELAAAKVRSLSVAQLAARLDDRFRLLTGRNRTALPRHQTLRAVIEWSWDLLTEPERILARRISVFPGGITLHAAERACSGAGLDPDDVLDVLAALVDKSLLDVVMPVNDDGSTDPRYRMLETVRAFGAERLAEAGETDAFQAAQARYFTALVEEAEPHLRTADQLHWMARLRADHDNLVAALRWAIANGDSDLAVRLCASMLWFWFLDGNRTESFQFVSEVVALPGDAPDIARVELLAFYSAVSFLTGRADAGRRAIEEALALLARVEQLDAHPLLALLSPMVMFFRDNDPRAVEETTKVLDHPDPWTRAAALMARAQLHENAGRAEESKRDVLAARDAFAAVGERWGLAAAYRYLGGVWSREGNHAGAIEANERALVLAGEIGETDDTAEVVAAIGISRVRSGDLAGGRADLERAVAMAPTEGDVDPDPGVMARLGLAELAAQIGDLAEAHRLLDEADALIDSVPVGLPHRRALVGTHRVWLAILEGDVSAARKALAVGLDQGVASKDMPVLASAVQAHAALAHLEGDPEQVAFLFGVADQLMGLPDRSDPRVVRLREQARALLAAPVYDESYQRGLSISREDVLTLVRSPDPSDAEDAASGGGDQGSQGN